MGTSTERCGFERDGAWVPAALWAPGGRPRAIVQACHGGSGPGFAAQVRCPVWFTQQWDDEFFDREGTAQLFDALGTRDKRLVAYPGPHHALEGERLDDAVDFLAGRLLDKAGPREKLLRRGARSLDDLG